MVCDNLAVRKKKIILRFHSFCCPRPYPDDSGAIIPYLLRDRFNPSVPQGRGRIFFFLFFFLLCTQRERIRKTGVFFFLFSFFSPRTWCVVPSGRADMSRRGLRKARDCTLKNLRPCYNENNNCLETRRTKSIVIEKKKYPGPGASLIKHRRIMNKKKNEKNEKK